MSRPGRPRSDDAANRSAAPGGTGGGPAAGADESSARRSATARPMGSSRVGGPRGTGAPRTGAPRPSGPARVAGGRHARPGPERPTHPSWDTGRPDDGRPDADEPDAGADPGPDAPDDRVEHSVRMSLSQRRSRPERDVPTSGPGRGPGGSGAREVRDEYAVGIPQGRREWPAAAAASSSTPEDARTDLIPHHRREEPADDAGGLFDLDTPEERAPRGGRRPRRRDRGEAGFGTGRRRGRRWGLLAAVAVLVLALAGGVAVTRPLWQDRLFSPDFEGPGTGSVVVQVDEGDAISTVGQELAARGVVASARTFGEVSEDDPRGRAVAPGFYLLHREMSAQGALDALLDPATRLGRVEVRGGTQLDDTAGPDGTTVPGVLSLIARATCAPDPAGTPVCRSAEDIRRVMVETPPAALGVPAWAQAEVAAAEPARRLEGLVEPGVYDVPPGSGAAEALTSVVRTSAERLAGTGLPDRAASTGLTPYQVLVVASIAEKEGIEEDFPKITRVIENRLTVPMPLQMDSTINFPLDRQTLLTTPFDRATPGPYNTYLNVGLPPTPIAATSGAAIEAALSPTPGGWIYFVKCETDGTSCFAVTAEEHDANRRLAQERGVY